MLQDDPQETIKDLSPKLNQADQFFRDMYKYVIMRLLDIETTIRKTPYERRITAESDTYAAGIKIISSIIAPGFAQRFYNEHQRKQRRPERNRQLNLKDASRILDRLDHTERMEYYKDFLSMGIIKTNYKWQNIINQKPRKKSNILGYEKNVP